MTTWETPARCGLASRRVAAPHARAAGRTRGSKGQELKAGSICSKATTLKPGFTAFAPGSNLTLRLPLYAFADRAVTDPRGAGLAGGGTPHGGTTSSMPLECHGGTLNRCTELCPADPPIAFTKCASICGSHCSPFRRGYGSLASDHSGLVYDQLRRIRHRIDFLRPRLHLWH